MSIAGITSMSTSPRLRRGQPSGGEARGPALLRELVGPRCRGRRLNKRFLPTPCVQTSVGRPVRGNRSARNSSGGGKEPAAPTTPGAPSRGSSPCGAPWCAIGTDGTSPPARAGRPGPSSPAPLRSIRTKAEAPGKCRNRPARADPFFDELVHPPGAAPGRGVKSPDAGNHQKVRFSSRRGSADTKARAPASTKAFSTERRFPWRNRERRRLVSRDQRSVSQIPCHRAGRFCGRPGATRARCGTS